MTKKRSDMCDNVKERLTKIEDSDNCILSVGGWHIQEFCIRV